jgi:hypothetical protein
MRLSGLGSSDSGKGPVVGSFKHDRETSGSIGCGEFLS